MQLMKAGEVRVPRSMHAVNPPEMTLSAIVQLIMAVVAIMLLPNLIVEEKSPPIRLPLTMQLVRINPVESQVSTALPVPP